MTGIPPYSQEAEEAVLGACLIDGRVFVDLAATLREGDFFLARHAYIWQALERIDERKEPVPDYLIVMEELRAMDKLDEIGGPAYLTRLINNTPSAVPQVSMVYAEIVRRCSHRRELMEFSDEIMQLANNEPMSVEDIDKAIHARWYELSTSRQDDMVYTQRDLMSEYFDIIEARKDRDDTLRGLPTGYADIDRLLLGMRKDDLIIVAGRPSMGKTALAVNMSTNVARLGGRVVFFSLEMGREQLAERLVAAEMNFNSQLLGTGTLSQKDWNLFVAASGNLSTHQVTWDVTSGITAMQIRGKLNRIANREGVDLVVVDYMQLMGSDRVYQNRANEVGDMAKQLKEIAKEFRVPLLAVAQVNRGPENRQDKRPVLSDLKESGDIEQAADVVMMVYRDAYYNAATEHPNGAEVIIAKHRNGPVGRALLHFDKPTTKFTNARSKSIDLETLKTRQREGGGDG
jgi:replicative DNA helicase